MQPTQQQTVITVQPAVALVMPREWNHSLCGCFDDCGECKFIFFMISYRMLFIKMNVFLIGLCAYCCPIYYSCQLATRVNESCFALCFGGLVPIVCFIMFKIDFSLIIIKIKFQSIVAHKNSNRKKNSRFNCWRLLRSFMLSILLDYSNEQRS